MHRPSAYVLRLMAGLLILVSLPACSPSLSPLYRDYEVYTPDDGTTDGSETDIWTSIEAALTEAEWEIAPASAPNIVATELRKTNEWIMYDVVVQLEVAPIGDRYVRVYIHPYRKWFTGNRSKIPYLKGSLRRSLLPKLNDAFEAHNLYLVGTAVDRDKEAEKRSTRGT